ncbi:hypothetical protein L6164_021702 [Bauhinia variegata]|uniref:Uncharacterized protein n=1 Tax=Bauhinia variegata TaxID=167791 RepID=A0ACB9N1B1_BAUVA|nr:hypothetical protein L6164_021702 [Bauhinia variegata]
MLLQTQSLTGHYAPSVTPTKTQLSEFTPPKRVSFHNSSFKILKCSLSTLSEPTRLELRNSKPFPAEVSRTIMERASVGTLSNLTQEGWPLGMGVRFAVDPEGTPVLYLNATNGHTSIDGRSSLHVQLGQSRLRTPQCTLQGSLHKPEDRILLERLISLWEKRFGEDIDEDLIYIVAVERVLQMEDFQEKCNAQPDPLREFAEELVTDINTNNMEDIARFCNVYVDLGFQVYLRYGFLFLEKSLMKKGPSQLLIVSQLAWEVEKNLHVPDFEKMKQLKHMKS